MIYKPTAQTFHAPILIKKKIDATTLRTNILFHTPYQLKFTDSNSPISAPKVQKISIRRSKILKYLTQNYKKRCAFYLHSKKKLPNQHNTDNTEKITKQKSHQKQSDGLTI